MCDSLRFLWGAPRAPQPQRQKAEGAISTEAAALSRPFGGVEQLPPGLIPYKRDEAEGIRGEYREDGAGAASSTAQAASRWNLAATEGPGGSGTTDSRRRFNSDLGLERRKQAAKARKKHKRAAARMASEDWYCRGPLWELNVNSSDVHIAEAATSRA